MFSYSQVIPAPTYSARVTSSDDLPAFDPAEVVGELLYVAVADHVAARIAAGDLPPGTRLPSERDLADEYRVSAPTVRSAIAVLRERKLVRTIHGKGTYVLR